MAFMDGNYYKSNDAIQYVGLDLSSARVETANSTFLDFPQLRSVLDYFL